MFDFQPESVPQNIPSREVIAIDGDHQRLPETEQPAKVLARHEEDGITFFTVERMALA